jgi:hypothetical protein
MGGGGGLKSAEKKCHGLFEWPHIIYLTHHSLFPEKPVTDARFAMLGASPDNPNPVYVRCCPATPDVSAVKLSRYNDYPKESQFKFVCSGMGN